MNNHKLDYRGHSITVKRDFGSGFHLVDGMPCNFGYNVIKDGCNATPGAGWYQTVADAKVGIDCLLLADGDAEKFHALYRAVRAKRQEAVESPPGSAAVAADVSR